MNNIFDYPHPYVCTDAVVFSIKTNKSMSYRKLSPVCLNIMLIKRLDEPFKGARCLPGGFLNIDELPEDCIKRKLSDKAAIKNCSLEQLYTFCDLNRDPRSRIISIAYMGLMPETEAKNYEHHLFELKFENGKIQFEKDDLILNAEDLGFDHYSIIQKAVERLRSKIQYSDMIFELMPDLFTLTQLQSVYELIMDRKELAANFRRKTAPMLEETESFTSDMGHRPAQLFKKKII